MVIPKGPTTSTVQIEYSKRLVIRVCLGKSQVELHEKPVYVLYAPMVGSASSDTENRGHVTDVVASMVLKSLIGEPVRSIVQSPDIPLHQRNLVS
jgi:hypothetical protein